MELESFSALLLEPSPTADFAVDPVSAARISSGLATEETAPRQLVVRESQPALRPNKSPDRTHFYERAEGSISALGWVNEFFGDVRVSGEVNTDGGPNGQGAVSRQGVMARWDLGNNFYWFSIDFTRGVHEIYRARYFGVFEPLPGSTGKIRDFKNTSAYVLELEMVGGTAQGRIYEPGRGGQRGRLVADTGKITDPDPHLEGVSGFLAEPAIEAPFVPLHASFGSLVSEAVGGRRPERRAEAIRIPDVPDQAQARFQRARALASQGDNEQAASQLMEALKAAPDYVEALNELAWIRATAEDSKLRNPNEAVDLAEKAVGRLVEMYDRRRQGQSNQRFSKNFLIRAGMTLAAAYASAGKFEQKGSSVVAEQLQTISDVEGVSDAEMEQAMSESSGMAALAAASWATSFAQVEVRRTNSQESQQLLKAGQEMIQSFKARRPINGKTFRLP